MNSKWKTAKGRRRVANRKYYLNKKAKAVVAAASGSSKGGVSLAVAKYVKKMIDKDQEDKHDLLNVWTNANCLQSGFDSSSTNSGLTTSNSIIPVVTQGVAVDNRIGNQIRPKSLIARLILQARPVNPTDNFVAGLPFYVRVVFYNRKDSMTNNNNTTILDLGGSNTGFTGSLASLLLKYNKDTFNIIKSYTFKMMPAQAVSASSVTSSENMANGFRSHIYKNVRLPIPKKLRYDDTAAQPNHRIYCAVGVVNADNSSVLPITTGYRLRVSMDTHLIFEDA